MKAVISTVSEAQVSVDHSVVAQVGQSSDYSLLALIGIGWKDTEESIKLMARKIAELRLFPQSLDGANPWDGQRTLSAQDVQAEILLVSQFTLMGSTVKGRRPSWAQAASADKAEPLFKALIQELRNRGLSVHTGVFGAMMEVQSVNQGPFTVLVDTDGGVPTEGTK